MGDEDNFLQSLILAILEFRQRFAEHNAALRESFEERVEELRASTTEEDE